MEATNNQEQEKQNDLSEIENEKPPRKGPNPIVSTIIGIFFIGYGIFRLTNTMKGDGSWNTIYGIILIVAGAVNIGTLFVRK